MSFFFLKRAFIQYLSNTIYISLRGYAYYSSDFIMISQYIREYFHKFVNSNLKRLFIYLSKFNLGVISLHPVYLIISLILTSIAFLLNLFAFMNIFPLWLSLPFLFLSIFVSLHFFIRFITFITK